MIGRFDSTQDRTRAGHHDGAGRRVARDWRAGLFLAALGMLAASTSEGQQQAPPRTPKAKVTAVVPMPAAPQQAPIAPASLPEMDGPAAARPAGGLTLPPEAGEPARRDPEVIPAEAATPPPAPEDSNPLPGASAPPGGMANGRGPGGEPESFVLPPDRLTPGKHRVQLSVDVQASPVINIGKESTVRLVVGNEGNVDAFGVSVVYQLPEGLEYVSGTPEATQDPVNKSHYYWKKSMLAANGDWTIVLKVVARESRACEHAATVTAKAGSRASTTVQEPKLKVEATAAPGRVLKGTQVTYQIAVTNPGTGPARGVIVQAKLSGGLKLGSDDIVEQTIDAIKPGERVALDPLIVDAVAGGQQSCTVEVRSPDVNSVPAEHRVTRPVEVTEPKLAVKLAGPDFRYTGQPSEYKLTVSNPGTAPAKKVKVTASLPSQGGRLKPGPLPAGAEFDKGTRRLFWLLPSLEPGQSTDLAFTYETNSQGQYRCAAEATSGAIRQADQMTTEVSGIAALDIQIRQSNRYLDVGKSNYYEITIKNQGTKEATRLQLSGEITKNLRITQQYGVDRGEVAWNKETGKFVFPEIDALAPGKTLVLGLDVQADASGPAQCHAYLSHAEMPDDNKVEDVISTMITGGGRPRPAAAARP